MWKKISSKLLRHPVYGEVRKHGDRKWFPYSSVFPEITLPMCRTPEGAKAELEYLGSMAAQRSGKTLLREHRPVWTLTSLIAAHLKNTQLILQVRGHVYVDRVLHAVVRSICLTEHWRDSRAALRISTRFKGLNEEERDAVLAAHDLGHYEAVREIFGLPGKFAEDEVHRDRVIYMALGPKR